LKYKKFLHLKKNNWKCFPKWVGRRFVLCDVALMNAFHFSSSIVNDPSLPSRQTVAWHNLNEVSPGGEV
jgi:hypothetical protein